jgi:hypothetical protein
MRSRPVRALVLAALSAAAVAGCGSNNNPEERSTIAGPSNGPQMVAAQDVVSVVRASSAITQHCRRPPQRALTTLIRVYQANPQGIVDWAGATADKSMTLVLEQKRDQLEKCGNKAAAAELDRALQSGS